MTHEEMLQRIVELTDGVRQATFERHRAVSVYRRTGHAWDAALAARREESRAVNKRDEFLTAVANHLHTRCHDLTDCPICLEEHR